MNLPGLSAGCGLPSHEAAEVTGETRAPASARAKIQCPSDGLGLARYSSGARGNLR